MHKIICTCLLGSYTWRPEAITHCLHCDAGRAFAEYLCGVTLEHSAIQTKPLHSMACNRSSLMGSTHVLALQARAAQAGLHVHYEDVSVVFRS